MIDSITAITLSHEMIFPVVFIDRFILFDKSKHAEKVTDRDGIILNMARAGAIPALVASKYRLSRNDRSIPYSSPYSSDYHCLV